MTKKPASRISMEEEFIDSLVQSLTRSHRQTMELLELATKLQAENERLLVNLERTNELNSELLKTFGRDLGMDPKVFEKGYVAKIDREVRELIERSLRGARS